MIDLRITPSSENKKIRKYQSIKYQLSYHDGTAYIERLTILLGAMVLVTFSNLSAPSLAAARAPSPTLESATQVEPATHYLPDKASAPVPQRLPHTAQSRQTVEGQREHYQKELTL